MKHEITSMNTKKAFAASLKKFMGHKKLSKITVSEIIADCGVNRKTFYYHFQDIYALFKWTIEQETVEVLKKFDLLLNPKEALIYIINYVENNSHILNCAYDSMSREEIKRFFYTDFYGIVLSIIEEVEKEEDITLDDSFKKYMVDFYTEALACILIDYFRNNEQRNRDELINHTLFILKTSIPHIMKEYSSADKNIDSGFGTD